MADEDFVVVSVSSGEVLPPGFFPPTGVELLLSPEDCATGKALAEAASLLADCATYALKQQGGRNLWLRLRPSTKPPMVSGQIYIYQVIRRNDPVSESPWGSAEAQVLAPSSMTNSMCIQLQAMDEQGNLRANESPQFLNFRPAYATPSLPAALAHVAFANFLDVFEGRKSELGSEDIFFFSSLALKCSRYYEEEAAYKHEVAELWKGYTGIDFINELNTGDGTHCGRHQDLKALYAVLEAKLGRFDSKSDPGMHGAQYVRLYWLREGNLTKFNCTCFPAVVIEHVGPFVRVSAVYVLDKLCFMPLTPFVNLLLLQDFAITPALQAARLCLATKLALEELSAFYRDPKYAHMELFHGIPYPLQQEGYVHQLAAGKLVYLLKDGVVVKYVQKTYGEGVHRAWANAGYAPKLYEVKVLPGGWCEVRMEYLGGNWRCFHGHPRAEELRSLVLSVLDKAHTVPVFDDCGVHGDARDVNVMVRDVGSHVEVKFIDFDWAGVEGVDRYPYFMNQFGVNWHEGASDGKVLFQEHDKSLLGKSQRLQTFDESVVARFRP